jgi:hypothetical protein
MLGRSTLRADSLAVLGFGARRGTRCVRWRSLRSNNHDESVVKACCARSPEPCALQRPRNRQPQPTTCRSTSGVGVHARGNIRVSHGHGHSLVLRPNEVLSSEEGLPVADSEQKFNFHRAGSITDLAAKPPRSTKSGGHWWPQPAVHTPNSWIYGDKTQGLVRAQADRMAVFTLRLSQGLGGQVAERFSSGEERRAWGGAHSAPPQLTRRGCLSAESASERSEFHDAPHARAPQRSRQRRPLLLSAATCPPSPWPPAHQANHVNHTDHTDPRRTQGERHGQQ